MEGMSVEGAFSRNSLFDMLEMISGCCSGCSLTCSSAGGRPALMAVVKGKSCMSMGDVYLGSHGETVMHCIVS